MVSRAMQVLALPTLLLALPCRRVTKRYANDRAHRGGHIHHH